MTSLYLTAVTNFRAAAAILEALQSARIDLALQARAALTGRSQLYLDDGYNNITSLLGICIDIGGSAELGLAVDGEDIELTCESADWITVEADIGISPTATTCYLELQAASDKPILADVFLREFIVGGGARDTGHRGFPVSNDMLSICAIDLPELAYDVTGRRIILHLRDPDGSLYIRSLTVTPV